MPTFTKTVSQLNRAELVSAANIFNLDAGGLVTILRARIKAHIDENQHYMDNPNYEHLFSRHQRAQYATRARTPTPPPWNGIGADPSTPPVSDDGSDEDEDDFAPADDHRDASTPPAEDEREAHIELLKSLPPAALSRAVNALFNAGSNSTAEPPVSTSHTGRKRPARVPGLTTSSSAFLVPEAIRKKFADGWKTHVPLQFLTDKYCSFANKSSAKELNDLFTMDGSAGTIVSVAKELPVDGELHLSFDEWFQAYGRLLELTQTHAKDEHPMWVAHFNQIMYRPNRADNWALCLEYDSQIRRRAVDIGIDPSVFHDKLWADLQAEHIGKRAFAVARSEFQRQGKNSGSDRDQGPSNGRFQPYDAAPRNNSDSTHSFRPLNGKSRCFVCGASDGSHPSRHCSADRLISGQPTILVAQPNGGPRRDRNSTPYCFSFNGNRGCAGGTNCTKGRHWCSICGSRSGIHTAQNCVSI
ncbi:hypothetical protein C8R47DRAFT_217404 [Mycena vitilis]|nr:hypothetical protein C8R47DRAFT_217404 [Mycena vitilis]